MDIYTHMLFGKGIGIDVGTMKANKVYEILLCS
jgi:hypothetical protein